MNTEPKKTEQPARPSLRQALKHAPRRLWMLLYHNWPWKLLALFLALCLWAGLITQDASLTRERVFSDVPITVSGADSLRRNSGLIVLSGLDEETLTARMRVDVPQREYNTVTYSNYNPRIDLTRITAAGEQTLKIQTTSTVTYGSVRGISPESVTVIIDEYVTNYRVPVSVNITGEYPDGFYGDAPSLDPSVVALSGPKSLVDQIARIYVDFDVSRLAAKAGTVRSALPMRFVTAEDEVIQSDLLEVTSADVVLRTITVEQELLPTRTIPLSTSVLTDGEPASGYRIKNVSASPTTLLAAGDHAVMDAIDALFIEEPVDVTDRIESFTVDVPLRIPSELAYVSAEKITVTVEIEPVIVSRTFSSVKLFARGTTDGLRAGLSLSTLSAVVNGPQRLVDSLQGANVVAYVDLTGLEAGEYELPVMLHVEDADTSSLTFTATPATVNVTLSEKK